jgi:hypothetical protein
MIVDDVVVNVCLWDGDTDSWTPPDGAVMERHEGQAEIGWERIDDTWFPAPSTDPPDVDAPGE